MIICLEVSPGLERWIRTYTAFAKNLCSIPSIHFWQFTMPATLTPGAPIPLAPEGPVLIYMPPIHIHTIKICKNL